MPDNDPPPSIGRQLYDAGWCQGVVLPEVVSVGLRPATTPSTYLYAVVVTQDCNIVADDHKEPQIEVAFGYRPASGENVNGYARGKNPRLFLTEVGPERFVWDVRERLSVTKADLLGVLKAVHPTSRLLDPDLREFRAWLGRRYSRPAFPDNFNERLQPASAAIEKAVKSDGFRSVRAVFYWLEEGDEELPEGTPYHLRVIFCFNHNGTESPLPATADEVKRFTDAVAKCPGVSLMKAESIPDSRFPIQYLDTWQCVDFDSRSYGSVTSAPPRL